MANRTGISLKSTLWQIVIFVAIILVIRSRDGNHPEKTYWEDQLENRKFLQQNLQRLFAKAETEAKQGHFREAQSRVKRLQTWFGNDYHYHILRAQIAIGLGQFDRARAAIATARALQPRGDSEIDLIDAKIPTSERRPASTPADGVLLEQ